MKVEVIIEVNINGAGYREIIELPDSATEAEIEEAANDVFRNHCSYGYTILDEDEHE